MKMEPAHKKQKRVVTSAIDGMSVKEVRRRLNSVRSQWMNANTDPFFLVNPVASDAQSIQKFSLLFVTGQHKKRHGVKPSGETRCKKK
jgi:hypothetical protein